MATTTKDEIAKMIASGMKPASVANRLNVSKAYIANLAEDEEFQASLKDAHAALINRRSDIITRQQRIDDFIAEAEEKTIKAISENIELIAKNPNRAIKAFQVLNTAKRRSHDVEVENTRGETNSDVVRLDLPEHIRKAAKNVSIKKNSQNEVIQVGERVLKTTPSAKLFQDLDDGKIQEELANFEASRIESPETQESNSSDKQIKMDDDDPQPGEVDINDL